MSGPDQLSLEQARRLAVRAQVLAGPRPDPGIDGLRQVLRAVRCLQLDPVNVVARSHLLVLWSRLGDYDRAHLDTLLWRERWLFEYWAHAASIVLAEDYPVHHLMMRAFPRYPEYRDWLTANEGFQRYVLEALRQAGTLAAESLEDRAAVGWVSTGWTHGRNVERMLDFLWKQGVINGRRPGRAAAAVGTRGVPSGALLRPRAGPFRVPPVPHNPKLSAFLE